MKKLTGIFYALLIISYFPLTAYAQSDAKAKLKAMKPNNYPTKEIEFTVNLAAGGGMDVTARMLGKHLEKYIDNRIVVMNRVGGGGIIGNLYVAKQAPNDGYTVGILSRSFWQMALIKAKYAYTDVEPLAFITYEGSIWVVSTTGKLKDKSIKEVLDIAKKNPNTIRINIIPGMSAEFNVERVEKATGARLIKVPFQGGKEGLLALLGGHIDIAQLYQTEFAAHFQAGKIKVVAACSHERHFSFPDVPTFNELLGVDNIHKFAYRYAAVPKGVPRDRFKYLEAAVDVALRDPACIKDFDEKLGLKVGPKYLNGKQTAEEIEKFAKMDREDFIESGEIPAK
jgi:tripartite-type tricarboxylate transporter receptor subunit TctC